MTLLSYKSLLRHMNNRDREEKVGEGETLHFRGGEENVPALKVPKRCPPVLLVEICLRENTASRCEEGKGL
jgi:hypothetical protein